MRERPNCRKTIRTILKRYDCSMIELYQSENIFLSEGLKEQLKKMFYEKGYSYEQIRNMGYYKKYRLIEKEGMDHRRKG